MMKIQMELYRFRISYWRRYSGGGGGGGGRMLEGHTGQFSLLNHMCSA